MIGLSFLVRVAERRLVFSPPKFLPVIKMINIVT